MNYSKYVAIALSSPQGTAYQDQVEKKWPQWLRIVEEAKWLNNTTKSSSRAWVSTPKGAYAVMCKQFPNHKVAESIYTSAVWGFGVLGKAEYDKYWQGEMCRILGIPVPVVKTGKSRSLYYVLPSGIMDCMPMVFRDLDNWLEYVTA